DVLMGSSNLTRANLTNADLSWSDLNEADLTGANLTGANLSYTNLLGVNFSQTIMPDGTENNSGQTPSEEARQAIDYEEMSYMGEVENEQPNGQGTLHAYFLGATYFGEFKDGKPHGQCTLITLESKWSGEFEDGKLNGQGIMIQREDGKEFTGEFKNNLPHGQVTMVNPDGSKLIGTYEEGLPVDGILYDQNGEEAGEYSTIGYEAGIYTGECKDGVPHGQGMFVHKSGETYDGEHKDGLPNGHGTLTSSESKYEGELKDGKRHGYGWETFTGGSQAGNEYVGDFEDDK
ncbi:uncharacterized protein METZ01_LOCUS391984, partial [marine metagenome]